MTVFGDKNFRLPVIQDDGTVKQTPVTDEVAEEAPEEPEELPQDPVVKNFITGVLGTTAEDMTTRMRVFFLRILSGYLERYGWTRLYENKWRFTTLTAEFRKGHGFLTFHAVAQYFLMGDHIEDLMVRIRNSHRIDNSGKTSTLLYIVKDQVCNEGKKWHRYGMYDGSEEMLAFCVEIPDDGEGFVVILRPEDRAELLLKYDEFLASLDDPQDDSPAT